MSWQAEFYQWFLRELLRALQGKRGVPRVETESMVAPRLEGHVTRTDRGRLHTSARQSNLVPRHGQDVVTLVDRPYVSALGDGSRRRNAVGGRRGFVPPPLPRAHATPSPPTPILTPSRGIRLTPENERWPSYALLVAEDGYVDATLERDTPYPGATAHPLENVGVLLQFGWERTNIESRARFEHLARFQHPNVGLPYAMGWDENGAYIRYPSLPGYCWQAQVVFPGG